MLNRALSVVLLGGIALTQMGCVKENEIRQAGYWQVNFFNDLRINIAAGDLPKLCSPSNVQIPMEISGSVDREYYVPSVGVVERQYNRALVSSNAQNTDKTAPYHYMSCNQFFMSSYNRAWGGEIFGVTRNYGEFTQDLNGRCNVRVTKSRDYRVVVITAEVMNRTAQTDSNGVTEKVYTSLAYDCQNGNVTNKAFPNEASILDQSVTSSADMKSPSAYPAPYRN